MYRANSNLKMSCNIANQKCSIMHAEHINIHVSNQCAEPSGSNLYVINWQSEGVALQYYQTLFISLACNRGSLSCVCSIALGVNIHVLTNNEPIKDIIDL